jgi:hypothetical protein
VRASHNEILNHRTGKGGKHLKKYFLAKSSRDPEFPNNNAAQLV